MIVRNEEAVIGRCLDSLAGLVDHWTICDTGSTDRTREIVSERLAGVPGRLHLRRWVDFGHNRSEAMELARGTADYLLLVDADMTVVRRGALPELTADAYLLRETGPLDHAVIRLVRGGRRWWYEGSTHEYVATDGGFRQEQLDAIAIEHHEDGGTRPEKLLRDVGLLRLDVQRRPDDPRPVFYLGQTYRGLGREELAIEHYRLRARMGGWEEEAFYAAFQAAALLARRDPVAGTAALLEAWQRRPSRAEPLYELSRTYRLLGQPAVARLFAEEGLKLSYPSDLLFVHRPVYEWGLRLERALAASDVGDLDVARADLLELLRANVLPRDAERSVATALADVDRRLGLLEDSPAVDAIRLAALAPSTRIGEIVLDVTPDWPCFNPSIAADGDGFRMIVRTANYAVGRGVLHREGILHNVNYLVTLDGTLAVTRIEPLLDETTGLIRHASQVRGYEDCRLFEHDGVWYATATVCELNPVERREIALLTLDGASIVGIDVLQGPDPSRHEKNWMPFVHDGHLDLLYACEPTRVLRHDVGRGLTTTVAAHGGPDVAREFRGGSQGLPVAGGFLFVVHQVDRSGPTVRYLHRFVRFDDALALTSLSPAFSFTGDEIEFCAGMARHGDDLVLSFGVGDAAAGLALVSLAEVERLLEPAG
jgi:hypothetical protein